jgi:hypothetical protein
MEVGRRPESYGGGRREPWRTNKLEKGVVISMLLVHREINKQSRPSADNDDTQSMPQEIVPLVQCTSVSLYTALVMFSEVTDGKR